MAENIMHGKLDRSEKVNKTLSAKGGKSESKPVKDSWQGKTIKGGK